MKGAQHCDVKVREAPPQKRADCRGPARVFYRLFLLTVRELVSDEVCDFGLARSVVQQQDNVAWHRS